MQQNGADKNDGQTHAIIGAAMEVHRRLGRGFLESVYQEALAIEFTALAIPFSGQVELPVFYRGQRLTCFFRADFVCFEGVIVELKAAKTLTGADEAQLLNYLKATRIERGLLVNFGQASLEFRRFVFSNAPKESADNTA